MSAYEDYTAVSADYDRTRVPVGVEIILGCLAGTGGDLSSQRVLDAGCGTGSYAAALRPHVGAIDAVDLNPSMLEVARAKLEGGPGCPVALHEAAIDSLPFEDARFDAVMVNQVLHHLPDSPAEGRPLLRRVLGELARVLRPGGAAVVNICSHEQIQSGWWYAALVPDAVATMRRRHADTAELTRLLADAGLDPRGRFVPSDALMRGDAYFNGRGSPRLCVASRGLAVVGCVQGGARAGLGDGPRAPRGGDPRRLRRRARSPSALRRADRVPLRGPPPLTGGADGSGRGQSAAAGAGAASAPASAGSTRAAQSLNPGILPKGSSSGLVRTLAAASA